jgi:hypothetical protein
LAVHRQSYLRATDGKLWGRPGRASESKYLLPGLARCATCGGGLYVKTRGHGTGHKRRRVAFYGCTSFHTKGSAVCTNSLEVPMDRADEAVLATFERDVLQPAIVARALELAIERLKRTATSDHGRRPALETRIATLTKELDQITAAIVAGGEAATLVSAMRQREAERAAAERELAALDKAHRTTPTDAATIEAALRGRLTEWRSLLRRHVPQARQILKKLLIAPVRFAPQREGDTRYYEFTAQVAFGRIFNGIADAIWVASPARQDGLYWPVRIVEGPVAA